MTITQTHYLSNEEAIHRIDGFLSQLQTQHEGKIKYPQKSWNADYSEMKFKFYMEGFAISGKIILTKGEVKLIGELPILVRTFADTKQITRTIEKEMKKLLA